MNKLYLNLKVDKKEMKVQETSANRFIFFKGKCD